MSNFSALFSVVVASHGRSALLVQLLESLMLADIAEEGVIEILVVDSSPTEEAAIIRQACDRLGAAFLEGPHSVRCKRNLGARTARGTWLLFIDSDCLASIDIFRAYHKAFQKNPEVRVAAGPTIFQGEENAFTRRLQNSSLLQPFRRPSQDGTVLWATTSNLCIYRDVFFEVGGFKENFPFRVGGDDTDLCLRVRDIGYQIKTVPAALCFHSWSTWSHPVLVIRRSFRWGWMHSCLLREYPTYRRIDAPGLPAHFLGLLALTFVAPLLGHFLALLLPLVFVVIAVVLHALLAAAAAPELKSEAFLSDLVLAVVELPFGFGRAVGSLSAGSLSGVLYRLDANDAEMDAAFPEIVRSLWSDHIAFLLTIVLAGIIL